MMKQWMDTVQYRTQEASNIITLVKYLKD